MTVKQRTFAYLAPLVLVAAFVGSFLLLPQHHTKHWPISPAAWGKQSSSCTKAYCSIFVVLGPKGDKSSRVEIDTPLRSPGLRMLDHPPEQAPDTLGATPTSDPCATIFSNPYVAVAAVGRGCQPPTADPRSTFSLLIVNRSDTPRVLEVQVYP